MTMGRFWCLVVACYCIALFACCLAAVEGRLGLSGGFGSFGGNRPVPIPVAQVTEGHGGKASSWSSTWRPPPPPPPPAVRGETAGDELRSVPSGPDPMHHHGSPERPDNDVP